MRRNKTKPVIRLEFWKRDGTMWYVEKSDLLEANLKSGLSEVQVRRRMGVGYNHIDDALAGKRLNGWAITHIEWGITPDSPVSNPPWMPK